MVTQQFTNWLANRNFKNISGTSVAPASATAGTALYGATYTYKSPTAKWIDVGFGSTVESSTDHALSDANATREYLTCINQAQALRESTDMYSVEATFKNEGSSPIIVREIGLFMGNVSNATSAYTDCLLVGRDLLSEPVQIEAGDSYKFTYKVSLNAQSVVESE